MGRNLNGSNQYLSIGDHASVDLTTNEWTLSAWAWPDALGGSDRDLIQKWRSGSNDYIILFDTSSRVMASARASNFPAGGAVTTGRFHHAAWTGSASGQRVFLNGALVQTANAVTMQNGTSALQLGGGPSSAYLDGRLAECAIWDATLSDAEVLALAQGVSPLMLRRQNLRGYWPLYGAASPEPDLSGNRIVATPVNSPTQDRHAPVGRLVPFAG